MFINPTSMDKYVVCPFKFSFSSACVMLCNSFTINDVQKIDGFLAVLNVTGGNFSPHPQKLPFAVTSMDGDNYRLYYSSIDLAGNLPSNRHRGPKMKRSLSIDYSRAEKSRLRIPIKGCIQLVLPHPPRKSELSFFVMSITVLVLHEADSAELE